MEQSSSRKSNSRSACQEILCPLWDPKVITVFARDRHWPLSWGRWIQCGFLYDL